MNLSRLRVAVIAAAFSFALLACASCASRALAAGVTRYVSPTGSDSNPGTFAAPYKTVKKGLSVTAAGDTLLLRGGTYTENVQVGVKAGTATAPVLFSGYPGERAVIVGLLWLSRPSYWQLSNINVTWRAGNSSTQHMVKITNGVGWRVKDCEFWGAHSFAGLLVAGTVAGEPRDWRVDHNAIHDTYPSNNTNQDHCIYCNTGIASGGNGIIERNLLYNAANGEGVKVGGANSGQGSVGVTVRYNTIYNCVQPILVSWRSSNILIDHNLLVKSSSKYCLIRGYQLTGTGNVATSNAGSQSKGMLLNDSGYTPIVSGGGNVFPLEPTFDAISPTGFHPTNTAAAGYGAYAP